MTFRLGVIGAGQLARMMVPAAVELGVEISVLAEAEGASAHLATTMVGDFTDTDTVRRFADTVDVVTFDHEHVPQRVLRALEGEGVVFRPGSSALQFAQDKLAMRRRLAQLGLPMPEWEAVRSRADIDRFVSEHRGRAILKTPRGGYDGHGVRLISGADEAADWLEPDAIARFDGELLIEEAVAFSRELSQLTARGVSGEIRPWVLAESIQQHGVCSEVIAPAPGAAPRMQAVAAQIAETVATELGVVGVLAVELFETADERILINELAMRPHNTGHWTMDGAITGQFEQHIRAVLGLPLGDPAPRQPVAAMVNILGGPSADRQDGATAAALAAEPTVKVHWYGKQYRPGRKVGHVNAYGEDVAEVVLAARNAAALLD